MLSRVRRFPLPTRGLPDSKVPISASQMQTTSACLTSHRRCWRGVFRVLGARAPIAVDTLPPPPAHPADLTGAGDVRARPRKATPRARLPPPFGPGLAHRQALLGRNVWDEGTALCPLGLVGMDDYAAVDSQTSSTYPAAAPPDSSTLLPRSTRVSVWPHTGAPPHLNSLWTCIPLLVLGSPWEQGMWDEDVVFSPNRWRLLSGSAPSSPPWRLRSVDRLVPMA